MNSVTSQSLYSPDVHSTHWPISVVTVLFQCIIVLIGVSPFLSHAAGQENMSPPCSPDLTLDRGSRDSKENKEPSPKVKRRRSVKISSSALEPAQWQNDALQILTCTNDYRSMNDFLMKKVHTCAHTHKLSQFTWIMT